MSRKNTVTMVLPALRFPFGDKPRTHEEALFMGFALALCAESEEQSQQCVAMAEQMARFVEPSRVKKICDEAHHLVRGRIGKGCDEIRVEVPAEKCRGGVA